MSPNVSNTRENIQNKKRQGRGKGDFDEHKPWILTSDFGSSGLASQTQGGKFNREYHSLSKIETEAFVYFDLEPKIIEIKEQYMLEIDETITIAKSLGIKHPSFKNIETVMTVDFLLTAVENGKPKEIARDLKYESDLKKKRTLEKLEITRTYMRLNNIDYGIITDKELDIPKVKNSVLFHPYVYPEIVPDEIENILSYQEELKEFIAMNPATPLRKICSEADTKFGYQVGTNLSIVYHLLATHVWKIDWNIEFSPADPLSLI